MKLKIFREILVVLTLAIAIFLLVQSTMQHFQVEGASMDPSLANGEHVLVNRSVYFDVKRGWASHVIPFLTWRGNVGYLFHPPNRGDIIIFKYPKDTSRDFIKRVIAIPGDTVEIKGGKVFVNGKALNEPYIAEAPAYDMPLRRIPPDNYFVLGDNRNNSSDSHEWGNVPYQNIIGKAWISIWPPKHWGLVPNRTIEVPASLVVISVAGYVGVSRFGRKSKWLL